MSEYGFIIDQMIWSFSRLNAFYGCRQAWKYNYIDMLPKAQAAFSQFGSFCHHILEKFEKGELSVFDVVDYYVDHFDEWVTEDFPPNKYKDLRESYFDAGLNYFETIDLLLDEYEILGIEKKVDFYIDDIHLVGFIDLLLKERNTGKIIILDHKSASIKLLKNGQISKQDREHFEEFKKQLYLYSYPVIQEYGHVDFLEWNMFRDGRRIKIPWEEAEFNEMIKWVKDTVEAVKAETSWDPNPDYFFCANICDQRHNCMGGNYGEICD